MKINIYSVAYPVTSLGPGERVVMWVAGCGRNCAGCISSEMQDPANGYEISVGLLARHLLNINVPLDGLTISGGEPLDQAPALAELLGKLHDARPEWSVIVYTGYTLESGGLDCFASFAMTKIDILIDGAYEEGNPSNVPLIGSANQRIHYLTETGRAMREAMESFPPGKVNWGIGPEGFDMIIGVADREKRTELRARMCGRENGEAAT